MSVLTTLMAASNQSVPGSWNIANVVYNPPASLKYNVSTILDQAFSLLDIGAYETSPLGVFFKPDGTKMYICGSGTDGMNQFNLSRAWDITTSSWYAAFSDLARDSTFHDLFISSDGLNVYLIGGTNDSVYQYSLSTAWDITTKSFVRSLSITAKETSPTGLHFKPNGTKMFIIGSGSDSVHEYALSTAWDISTATFTRTKSVSAQATSADSLRFTENGLNMYVLNAGLVHQYTLSTAWDISTATFSVTSSAQVGNNTETGEAGIYISEYGNLFCCGTYNDSVYLSALGAYKATETVSPSGVFVSTNGLNLYTSGYSDDLVYQYSLSTKNDLSSVTYVRSFSIAAYDSTLNDLYFSQDGTKMFCLGNTYNSVYKFILSTAWDISTATYSQTFSASTQESVPTGLHMSANGLYLYVTGSSGDDVNQYTLTTAWDLSTATYTRVFSVSAQGLNPTSLRFKNDGTKMYVLNQAEKVAEYSLSTAWDISTATYTSSYDYSLQTIAGEGLAFSNDGSVMFIADGNYGIFQYSVRT